jgi:hypothetical protein
MRVLDWSFSWSECALIREVKLIRHLMLLMLAVSFPSITYADIYKCISDDGQVYFSDVSSPKAICKKISVCVPDLDKWSSSPVAGTYYLNEATRVVVGKNQFIKIWISRLEDPDLCSFKKEYLTIDCISKASGSDWFNVSPVDPDGDSYSVINDICRSYPAKSAGKQIK